MTHPNVWFYHLKSKKKKVVFQTKNLKNCDISIYGVKKENVGKSIFNWINDELKSIFRIFLSIYQINK